MGIKNLRFLIMDLFCRAEKPISFIPGKLDSYDTIIVDIPNLCDNPDIAIAKLLALFKVFTPLKRVYLLDDSGINKPKAMEISVMHVALNALIRETWGKQVQFYISSATFKGTADIKSVWALQQEFQYSPSSVLIVSDDTDLVCSGLCTPLAKRSHVLFSAESNISSEWRLFSLALISQQLQWRLLNSNDFAPHRQTTSIFSSQVGLANKSHTEDNCIAEDGVDAVRFDFVFVALMFMGNSGTGSIKGLMEEQGNRFDLKNFFDGYIFLRRNRFPKSNLVSWMCEKAIPTITCDLNFLAALVKECLPPALHPSKQKTSYTTDRADKDKICEKYILNLLKLCFLSVTGVTFEQQRLAMDHNNIDLDKVTITPHAEDLRAFLLQNDGSCVSTIEWPPRNWTDPKIEQMDPLRKVIRVMHKSNAVAADNEESKKLLLPYVSVKAKHPLKPLDGAIISQKIEAKLVSFATISLKDYVKSWSLKWIDKDGALPLLWHSWLAKHVDGKVMQRRLQATDNRKRATAVTASLLDKELANMFGLDTNSAPKKKKLVR